MPDFSVEGMNRWMSTLPHDIKSCLGNDTGSLGTGQLISALERNTPEDMVYILPNYDADINSFGRARRLRLMSWILNNISDNDEMTLSRILAELIGEDDEGNGGSKGQVSLMLYEDYLAFATSLGLRASRTVINAENMDIIMNSTLTAQRDMENKMEALK